MTSLTRLTVAAVVLPLVLGACTTVRESLPSRTAREQMLISYAVIDSLDGWNLSELTGRRVYLDDTYFESIDQAFVLGELREWLGRQDVVLVPEEENAEVRLEVRSAGIGIEKREALLGIPSMPLPIPGATTFQTPEISAYKSSKLKGLAAIAVTAFEVTTGRRLFGYGPEIGQTYQSDAHLLLFKTDSTRVNLPPELEWNRVAR